MGSREGETKLMQSQRLHIDLGSFLLYYMKIHNLGNRSYKTFKGPVCKNNESVQGLHVGFYSTNRFKSPVCEQVVVEVKT